MNECCLLQPPSGTGLQGSSGAWWALACELVDSEGNAASEEQQQSCGEDYLGPRWAVLCLLCLLCLSAAPA